MNTTANIATATKRTNRNSITAPCHLTTKGKTDNRNAIKDKSTNLNGSVAALNQCSEIENILHSLDERCVYKRSYYPCERAAITSLKLFFCTRN